MKKITFHPNNCTRCNNCITSCAIEKSQSKELFQAITETPIPQPRLNIKQRGKSIILTICKQCQKAPCIDVCSYKALVRDEDFGYVVINQENCQFCGLCVNSCPIHAITISKLSIAKCDVCIDRQKQGLKPSCVSACPTNALSF